MLQPSSSSINRAEPCELSCWLRSDDFTASLDDRCRGNRNHDNNRHRGNHYHDNGRHDNRYRDDDVAWRACNSHNINMADSPPSPLLSDVNGLSLCPAEETRCKLLESS